MRKGTVFLLVGIILVTPATALATIGVGVGTGRIVVRDDIKSGKIYKLPPITVFNTGTERATYTVSVTLNEKQPQLKPDPDWISFSPDTFALSPGKAQVVTPTLHPPLRAKPGEYFAYLEAHPEKTVTKGSTAVGVAAATKLSFHVTPSNIFIALFDRLIAVLQLFSPWSYIAIALAILLLVYRRLRKHFNFSIRISKV